MTTMPRTGATELVSGQAIPETTVNENLRAVEAGAAHFPVADRVTAPPGTCADGANYIVIATATGAFTGKEGQIATALGVNAGNGWFYRALGTLGEGTTAFVQDEDATYRWSGSAWASVAAGGTAAGLDFDTDGTLAANSDAKVATQKATKTYVDGKVAGLSWKQAVRAASTANGTLASAFENGDSLDGVTLATGDRFLLKNQSSGAENGIYTVNASGAPTRATDADAGAELVNASVYVSEGTTNADTQWTCTTDAPITVGSTSLTWAQINTTGVSYASSAEINTGTEAAKAVSPDALAGSNVGKRVVQIQVTDPAGTAIATGDGQAYFRVPSAFDGMNLVEVAAAVTTVSSSGLPTVQIANVTDAVDMLSTKLSIDASETDSRTAATPAVIDATHDDVATGDMLRVDIDVAGTGAKGLIVVLTFQLP